MAEKKIWRWLFLVLILLILLGYGGGRLYYKLTDNFTIHNITSDFAYRENLPIPPASPQDIDQVNQILDQPFTYLGKGAQAYAFLSEDGKYVLKIVKQKHYKFSTLEDWFLRLPFMQEIRERKLQKRQRKMTNFLASCVLCYEEMRKETALLYIHLNQTEKLHHPVRIYDKLGIPHTLEPDQIEFILQRKAELLTTTISSLMEKQNSEEAKQAVDQVSQLFFSIWQKGIVDRDAHFLYNVGFVDGQAMFIDVGEFYKDASVKDPKIAEEKLPRYLKPLTDWLQQNYPELL